MSVTAQAQEPLTSTIGYEAFKTIVDDSGRISVDVPQSWSDVESGVWSVDGQAVGTALSASPNLGWYELLWTVPGMFIGVSPQLAQQTTAQNLLDTVEMSAQCTFENRYEYTDLVYTGAYDVWTDCGGQDTIYISLAAESTGSRGSLILLTMKIVSDADVEE
jgi:serine protease Do